MRATLVSLSLLLVLALAGCVLPAIPSAVPADTGVPPAAAEVQPPGERPPADVVGAFYDWYLAYARPAADGTVRNPIVDQAYHESDLLTESYKDHVDEMVASFEGGGFDPFLCAQDVPNEIQTDGVFMAGPEAGGTAYVLVRTDFPGHAFTVDLFPQEDGSWRIGNVTCSGTPTGQAKAFYTWYLGYMGDRATDSFRNPLVDKVYQTSDFLSAGFVTQVDEALAGMEGGGFDPFLQAQDIPQGFSIDPGMEENTATVNLLFGPDSMRVLKVTFIEEDGHLLIDNIEPAETPTPGS